MTEITKYCTGCKSCLHSCPKRAINMIEDAESFTKAHIDQELCIDCNICKKVCPQENNIEANGYNTKAWAAIIDNPEILKQSSSGGFFSALALDTLAEGGSVFGVKVDDYGHAIQTCIEKESELNSIRSSKYLASDTLNTYIKVKEILASGKKVMYSGLPCQIAGLKSYLKKTDKNLLCVDLICHGTPSIKLFDVYKEGIKQKHGDEIKDFIFRDKSRWGWGCYWSYTKKNGKKRMGGMSDNPYIAVFIDGSAKREACYRCKYVGLTKRPGDITLGDYWGIDQVHPSMASNKGVSAIIANSSTGEMAIERALTRCNYIESNAEKIAKYNPSLVSNGIRPAKRDQLYEGIYTKDPAKFIDENLYIPRNQIIKTRIRLLIPYNFRIFIKRVKKLLTKR